MCSASDVLSSLPDDLGEVAKSGEVGHVDIVSVVGAGVEADFAIVHVIGDHLTGLIGCVTGANVLAIATTASGTGWKVSIWTEGRHRKCEREVDLRVMCIDAGGSSLSSDCSKVGRPSEICGRVVGTVDVVLLKKGGYVVKIADVSDDS